MKCHKFIDSKVDDFIITYNLSSSDANILSQCQYLKTQINDELIFVSSDTESRLLKGVVDIGLEILDLTK